MQKDKIKYHFTIPDSIYVWTVSMSLLSAMQEHKEWFYDDFVIDSCYGCPQGCIWNGNMAMLGEQDNDFFVQKIVEGYAKYGVKYRLTFTNFMLKKKHLLDEYGNALAAHVENYAGAAIVGFSLMHDFIRTHYPNLGIIWSTTTDYGETITDQLAKINELSAEEMVVLPYDFNNKPVLKELTHPDHIEILVNEECMDNCPMRQEHYKQNNLAILRGAKERPECYFENKKRTSEWQTHSVVHRAGLDKYVNLGIVNFKLTGRIEVSQALGAYLHYFVLEEHWLDYIGFVGQFYYNGLVEMGLLPSDVYFGSIPPYFDKKTIGKASMVIEGLNYHGEASSRLW